MSMTGKVAELKPPYDTDDQKLLALCLWRKARGESKAAKLGVAFSILNRVKMAPAEGFRHSIRENILKPWQYTSFMEGDPNAVKYPTSDDPSWVDSLDAAADAMQMEADPIEGAVFYYSPPLTAPPVKQNGECAWGDVEHTVSIGNLHFHRLVKA